jgi:hypothetical protein
VSEEREPPHVRPRSSADHLRAIGDFRSLANARLLREEPLSWYPKEEADALTDEERALAATFPDPLAQPMPINDRPKRYHDTESPELAVERLSNVSSERTEWLWPGRMPRGALVIMDGDPSLGKSTVALDIGARVSTGSPFPDGEQPARPANVIVMSAEDDLSRTIAPRLFAAEAARERITSILGVWREGIPELVTLPRDLALLEEHVEEEKAALVIVDVLAAYIAGNIDAHRDTDIRRLLAALSMMAHRTGATVLCLRHHTKASASNPLYRGGGSIGIVGAARAAMAVAPHPARDGRICIAPTKSNLATMPPSLAYRIVSDEFYDCSRIAWEGIVDLDAAQLLSRELDSEEQRADATEAEQFLIDALCDEEEHASEDLKREAKREGISADRLRRAARALRVVVRNEGFPRRTLWSFQSQQSHSQLPLPPKGTTDCATASTEALDRFEEDHGPF